MTEFAVISERSPGLGEGEARHRLGQVYALLLRRAAEKEAAVQDAAGDQARTAADTLARKLRTPITIYHGHAPVPKDDGRRTHRPRPVGSGHVRPADQSGV